MKFKKDVTCFLSKLLEGQAKFSSLLMEVGTDITS